ncbi:MAG: hypothetical protein HC924_12695 [Synechococcaceae cyanobacterium SM2_3_2]|nr:hypothetical protein [Synechococcaceae cyanobacterium SM2_3_2]
MFFQKLKPRNQLMMLATALSVSGLALIGCSTGVPTASDSPLTLPVAQAPNSTQPETITLFFDGEAQTFLIADLAVAVALFLNPDASITDIQQVGLDIFGVGLTEAQITGAGPNPLANFDLNGDGIQGTIQDLGVAIAAFLGATTREEAEQIGIDLGITLNIAPGVEIPGPRATPFPTPVPLPSIVELALATPDLSTLVEALIAAGLVDTLSGEGPFTVFAPNNDAFAALLEDTPVEDVPVDVLTEILLYHVVAGQLDAEALLAAGGATTLRVPSGSGPVDVTVTTDGTNLFINDSLVLAADIEASNGIVFVIDEVLDALAPTLVSSSPEDGATNVEVDAPIVLSFSEPVQAGLGSIIVSGGNDVRAIDISDAQVSFAGGVVTLNLTEELLSGTSYTVSVPDGAVEDLNGNHFAGVDISFDTVAAPAVTLSIPGVEVGSTVTVTTAGGADLIATGTVIAPGVVAFDEGFTIPFAGQVRVVPQIANPVAITVGGATLNPSNDLAGITFFPNFGPAIVVGESSPIPGTGSNLTVPGIAADATVTITGGGGQPVLATSTVIDGDEVGFDGSVQIPFGGQIRITPAIANPPVISVGGVTLNPSNDVVPGSTAYFNFGPLINLN